MISLRVSMHMNHQSIRALLSRTKNYRKLEVVVRSLSPKWSSPEREKYKERVQPLCRLGVFGELSLLSLYGGRRRPTWRMSSLPLGSAHQGRGKQTKPLQPPLLRAQVLSREKDKEMVQPLCIVGVFGEVPLLSLNWWKEETDLEEGLPPGLAHQGRGKRTKPLAAPSTLPPMQGGDPHFGPLPSHSAAPTLA
jgi:hypothetical protein